VATVGRNRNLAPFPSAGAQRAGIQNRDANRTFGVDGKSIAVSPCRPAGVYVRQKAGMLTVR
ncbi:MAG TPA: hypothetical protein VF335_08405, partial [Chitinivibrionales bacterium]